MWTGNSVDLGETFSGRSTPDSEAFRDNDALSSAVTHYDVISDQVRALRHEMDELHDKLHVLSSRDNLSYLPPPLVDPELLSCSANASAAHAQTSSKRYPVQASSRVLAAAAAARKRHASASSCDAATDEQQSDVDTQSVSNLSDTRRSDLNWDYGSDLGAATSAGTRRPAGASRTAKRSRGR